MGNTMIILNSSIELAMEIFATSKSFPKEEGGRLLYHMINNPEKY